MRTRGHETVRVQWEKKARDWSLNPSILSVSCQQKPLGCSVAVTGAQIYTAGLVCVRVFGCRALCLNHTTLM
jgi:hypothetical protein